MKKIAVFAAGVLSAALLIGCGEPKYTSLEEFYNLEENSGIYEQNWNQNPEKYSNVSFRIEGNVLIFEYTSAVMFDNEQVAQMVEESKEDVSGTMGPIVDGLREEAGLPEDTQITVRSILYNNDGSFVAQREYTK